MATKPTLSNARWGETAGGVPEPSLVSPTSGEKDTGWAAGAKPPAQKFNYTQHEFYLWAKYVDGGIFQHPEEEFTIPGAAGIGISNFAPGLGTSGPGLIQSSNPGNAQYPIVLPVGKRLTAVEVTYRRDGTGTLDFNVYQEPTATGDLTPTSLASASDNTGSTRETLVMSAINHTIAADSLYYLEIVASSAASEIFAVKIKYDRITS